MDEQYDEDYCLDVEDADINEDEPEAVEPEAFIITEDAVEKIRAETVEKLKDSSLTDRQIESLALEADNDAVGLLFDSLLTNLH